MKHSSTESFQFVLRPENKDRISHPLNSDVELSLDDLDAGYSKFVILDNPQGGFLQTTKSTANGFLMEYKDDSASALYRSTRIDFAISEIKQTFSAFLASEKGWNSRTKWAIEMPGESKDLIATVSKFSWIPIMILLLVAAYDSRDPSKSSPHLPLFMSLVVFLFPLTTLDDIRKWQYLDLNRKIRIVVTLLMAFMVLCIYLLLIVKVP